MILDMDGTNDTGQIQVIDDDQLVATLDYLGVEFLAGGNVEHADPDMPPNLLLAGLANSDEARVRVALIPLFLLHPEFSSYIYEAMRNVLPEKQHYLKCYYLAAYLLQQKYCSELESLFGTKEPLPALFEQMLPLIDSTDVDDRLRRLSALQIELSNRPINWYGTYEHAYSRLVDHKVWKSKWQQ